MGLGDALGLSVGPALYFSAPQPFRVALRAPAVLSWYPKGALELFLEIAPGVGFWWADFGSGLGFRLSTMVGVRYLFSGN